MTPALKASLSICLAGRVNSGKTTQAVFSSQAKFITPDGEVVHPFGRVLYYAVGGDRQSAAGPGHDLVTSPTCRFVKPSTVDEAQDKFAGHLREGIAGAPFDMVVMDSWSSFKDQAAAEVRARAVTEAGGKSLSGQASKRIANNPRDIHKFAANDVAGMVQQYNAAGIDRPRLLLSMVHTDDLYINDIAVGQKPVASAAVWRQIWGSQNIIWHMHRELGAVPSRPGMTAAAMNAAANTPDTFMAFTMAKKWPMPIGQIEHVKRQGGGSMEAFNDLPPVWESPNLGSVLLDLICRSHNLDIGTEANPGAHGFWVPDSAGNLLTIQLTDTTPA